MLSEIHDRLTVMADSAAEAAKREGRSFGWVMVMLAGILAVAGMLLVRTLMPWWP